MQQKVSEFDWWEETKENKNCKKSIRLEIHFQWEHSLGRQKKSFEVLSGNRISFVRPPTPISHFETNKRNRPRKTNVNWQITSARLRELYQCTGDKVKLKVNVIWCLSISRSLIRITCCWWWWCWSFSLSLAFISKKGKSATRLHFMI